MAESWDLLDMAHEYLKGSESFDDLYLLALEMLPALHHDEPSSPASRLASLVVLLEAQESAAELSADDVFAEVEHYLIRPQNRTLFEGPTAPRGASALTTVTRPPVTT